MISTEPAYYTEFNPQNHFVGREQITKNLSSNIKFVSVMIDSLLFDCRKDDVINEENTIRIMTPNVI
jgi:hypothetical protein